MKKISITLLVIFYALKTNAQGIQFEHVPQNIADFDGVFESSIAFADVDGDNDQDVLITGKDGDIRIAKLYTNNGTGSYTEVIGTPFEGVTGSVAFSDVDGDNDQDVFISGMSGNDYTSISKLYTNDGSGNYTEVIGTPFDGVWDDSIAFSDVDGDNDQDVLITGYNSNWDLIAKLYINDGTGNYAEVTGTPFAEVLLSSIAFADVDGDNDQDVLITGLNSSDTYIAKLYTNNGSGSYSEVTGTPFDGVYISSIAFSDVDGDNDEDVLITGKNSSGTPIAKLYQNVCIPTIWYADSDGDTYGDNGTTLTTQCYQPIGYVLDNTDCDDTDSDVYPGAPTLLDGKENDCDSTITGLFSEIDKISFYPNPVTNWLTINTLNLGITQIQLLQIDGRLVEEFNKTSRLFNVSNIVSGTYLLKITTADKVLIERIVKK